jgi:hypothetical protein
MCKEDILGKWTIVFDYFKFLADKYRIYLRDRVSLRTKIIYHSYI